MTEIFDLRSALDSLSRAGELMTEVDTPLDPGIELSDDYLASYHSCLASWYTSEQPLRLYCHPTRGRFPVLMGMFGSRTKSTILLCGSQDDGGLSVGARLAKAACEPLQPTESKSSVSRNVVHHPDLNLLLPAMTLTRGDPGPTISLGMVYARDCVTGAANCSVHRITLKGDSAVIAVSSSGDLRKLIDLHVARGQRLPVSVNIGLDPAVYYAAALSSPAVGFGDDELAVAGALRGRPVRIAPCFTNKGWFVDHAEIVIEGSLGAEKEPETTCGGGDSMPEYLGYFSPAGLVTSMDVSAMSYREGAVYQSLSGPGREQSELLGIAQEAAIWRLLYDDSVERYFRNVVALPAGGGHLFTVLQVVRREEGDDTVIFQTVRKLFEKISTTKNLVLVDEDVNPWSADDILWAISTRARLDRDIFSTPSLRGTALDPTQSGHYTEDGLKGKTTKCVIDCTIPFRLKSAFRRAYSPPSAGRDN